MRHHVHHGAIAGKQHITRQHAPLPALSAGPVLRFVHAGGGVGPADERVSSSGARVAVDGGDRAAVRVVAGKVLRAVTNCASQSSYSRDP